MADSNFDERLERDRRARSIAAMRRPRSSLWLLVSFVCAPACADKELDASDPASAGEACTPEDVEGDAPHCAEGLACEPTTDGGFVCAARLEIRGQVIDALSGAAIADAVVAALDETGAPIGDAARSDADGRYVLLVSALRNPDGKLAPMSRWTMFSVALDYRPFPGGVRAAIPVDAKAPPAPQDDDDDVQIIENPTTTIALIPADDAHRGGVTITGKVGGEHPGGTLVVAEGGAAPAPYTIADASGDYVLFNVQGGTTAIHGYRRGLELEPASVDASGDTSVDLVATTEDPAAMAVVTGSVNIVNAPGGSATTVVLVPSSVYDEALERGPVPAGLRAPQPPEAANVNGAFTIDGVPGAEYHVLAAFENDALVRDPDTSIGGTSLQVVTVPTGGTAVVPESFKITAALEVVGPGADTPELVTGAPMLRWADDSSEDVYEVVVFDALGDKVWEKLDVPRVTGNKNVEVAYEGPLVPGMYYQFRATSLKDGTPISRTEDLRGVFVIADP